MAVEVVEPADGTEATMDMGEVVLVMVVAMVAASLAEATVVVVAAAMAVEGMVERMAVWMAVGMAGRVVDGSRRNTRCNRNDMVHLQTLRSRGHLSRPNKSCLARGHMDWRSLQAVMEVEEDAVVARAVLRAVATGVVAWMAEAPVVGVAARVVGGSRSNSPYIRNGMELLQTVHSRERLSRPNTCCPGRDRMDWRSLLAVRAEEEDTAVARAMLRAAATGVVAWMAEALVVGVVGRVADGSSSNTQSSHIGELKTLCKRGSLSRQSTWCQTCRMGWHSLLAVKVVEKVMVVAAAEANSGCVDDVNAVCEDGANVACVDGADDANAVCADDASAACADGADDANAVCADGADGVNAVCADGADGVNAVCADGADGVNAVCVRAVADDSNS